MPDTVTATASAAVVLELVCAPSALAKLTRHTALKTTKVRRPRARPLRLTWYDTASYALAGRDLALTDRETDWALERLGLGWPHRPGLAPAAIATAINPAGLDDAGYAIPGPLQKTGSLTGEQQRFPVIRDGVTLDCTLTTGQVTVYSPQGTAGESQPILRLTVSGPLTAAMALAQALAADLPVLPAFTTLPQEVLQLRGAKLKAPAAPVLSPDLTTATAFTILASGFVQTFLTRLEQIEDRQGPEAVHQARVTMRRLRALMLAFRPILGDAESRLMPLLSRLKTVLGPARDWDVFLSETVERLAGSLPEADPAIDWLRSAATARREAAYATLIDWLHRPDYRALTWRLAGLCLEAAAPDITLPVMTDPASGTEAPSAFTADAPDTVTDPDLLIGGFARHCLENRWKKTMRPVRELIPMPLPELHELRIKCKKLRYQAEMLQDALPAKTARKLIKRLAETQEVMGLLNDGAVATELAVSLRPGQNNSLSEQLLAAEAIGVIHGYSIGHTRDGRTAVIEAWRNLSKSSPF